MKTKTFVVSHKNPLLPILDKDVVCEPYITQDGYDSGQVMRCDKHALNLIPVYISNGEEHQSYEVTLKDFQEMIKIHKTEFGEPLDD